jgi:hypothetical protein
MPRSTEGSGSPETGAVGLMEPGSSSSPVEARPDAAVSPDMVNIFEEAVSPGAAPGLRLVRPGDRPAGDAIALSVVAWVRNVAYDKDVWVDLYVLGEGGVLHAETIPLAYQEPAQGGGDFFAAGAAVPAPKAGPGASSLATLQFRVYGQMNGQVFTDGILHSHQIEATPVTKASPKQAAVTTTADPAAEPVAAKASARKTAAPRAAKTPKVPAEGKPAAAPKARKPRTPKV